MTDESFKLIVIRNKIKFWEWLSGNQS